MDSLIESVGSFGRFQRAALFIIGLISAISSTLIYGTVFIVAEPDLICPGSNSEKTTCQIWSQNQSANSNCSFDTTYYGTTIVTEWGLICDDQYKAGFTVTLQILGSILGFFGGTFGDTFGRRRGVLLFSTLLTITTFLTQFLLTDWSFFPHLSIGAKYWTYSISQFAIGLLVNGLYGTAYVLLMELTTDENHTIFTNINSYFYVIGQLLVFIVYYVSKSWHFTNWFIAFNSLLILVMVYFLLPESPVWLLSCGRKTDAIKVFKKIAKFNKKRFDAEIFLEIIRAKGYNQITEEDSLKSRACCSWSDILMLNNLFYPVKTLHKTFLVIYIWAAIMLVYYGVSLGVTSVDLVNPYVIYFFSAAVEVIGYTICLVNTRLGPKLSMIGFFLISSVGLGVLAFLTQLWGDLAPENSFYSFESIVIMLVALVGKLVISGKWLIYIYTVSFFLSK